MNKKGKCEDHLLAKEESFAKMGLDPRIERSIEKILRWTHPSLIQSSAIPLALQGRDILARAKTGSGKTGAYSVPIVQKILLSKQLPQPTEGIRGLILVPTRELVHQVREHFLQLTEYASDAISVLALSADIPFKTQKARLAELPDILIATPKVLVDHLVQQSISLKESLEMLVIDEADYLFSYGFENDIRQIKEYLPKILQGFLMSATLSTDVQALKELVLHSPAVLQLEETEDTEEALLQQHSIHCPEKDKFLMAYFMLKMKLIPGKALFFVNDINRSFRLKLFLERFCIKVAVLNSELPLNSRLHIIQQFNKGVFDYLVATDEKSTSGGKQSQNKPSPNAAADDENDLRKGKEKEGARKRKREEEAKPKKPAKVEEDDDDEDSDEEEEGEEVKPKKGSAKMQTDEEAMKEEEDDDDDEDISYDKGADDAAGMGEEDGGEAGFFGSDDDEEKEEEEDEEEEEGEEEEEEEKNEKEEEEEEEEEEDGEGAEEKALKEAELRELTKKQRRLNQKMMDKDAEYGVSRGVDFKGVQAVINFDFPPTVDDYIHRVGRTARGGNTGMAISFVTPEDETLLKPVTDRLKEKGQVITPYTFKMALVEGFRYRVEDTIRGVTRAHVRDARIAEIKAEILNSKKLKTHFEEHPADLMLLAHDRPLLQNQVKPHLKYVPSYLMPRELVQEQIKANVAQGEKNLQANTQTKKTGFLTKKKGKMDPLKSFNVSSIGSRRDTMVDDFEVAQKRPQRARGKNRRNPMSLMPEPVEEITIQRTKRVPDERHTKKRRRR